MILHPNSRKGAKLRSWRGRHRKCTVHINEVFNDDLQTVDRYSYKIVSIQNNFNIESVSDNMYYDTINDAKDAAIQYINKNLENVKNPKERPAYLKSCNLHNFRHGQESPRVIGLVNYTPDGLDERLCLKVQYESDNKTDYVAYSELLQGSWEVII